MTEDEEFIYESIVSQVRTGFLPIDEIKENILEEIEDNGFEEEISEKWVNKQTKKEWEKLLSESKQWENPTDTQKLIKAFDELCSMNIIALHNAGYTTSDGNYEVGVVEQELRNNNKPSQGYCFYHEQDLMRALAAENPSLSIAFQKIENSDEAVTIEVGKKVSDVLRKNGLEVEWNETADTKILIPNFKWQLVYDEDNRDLADYKQVVALMLQ